MFFEGVYSNQGLPGERGNQLGTERAGTMADTEAKWHCKMALLRLY